MFEILKKDIDRTYRLIRGGRIKKIIGCYRAPGVMAAAVFRFGAWLLQRNLLARVFLMPIYYYLHYRMQTRWGISVSLNSQIGPGLYIGHFGGIFVRGKIGKNANISQGVTIGVSGRGDKRGFPTIGDNVYIGAGAKLFGKITIGNNAKIGANCVVYRDVPDNATVASPDFQILSYKSHQESDLEAYT
jgi:serine O-acetyltransferase